LNCVERDRQVPKSESESSFSPAGSHKVVRSAAALWVIDLDYRNEMGKKLVVSTIGNDRRSDDQPSLGDGEHGGNATQSKATPCAMPSLSAGTAV
jgi:hypothetical protein